MSAILVFRVIIMEEEKTPYVRLHQCGVYMRFYFEDVSLLFVLRHRCGWLPN